MSEIFRHYRPLRVERGELVPNKLGGVSFLLLPIAEGQYNFWLYMCPLSAGFSAKAAVARLRDAVHKNVVPWGTILTDGRPLIEQLLEEAQKNELPSDVARMIKTIHRVNDQAQRVLDSYKSQDTKKLYAED